MWVTSLCSHLALLPAALSWIPFSRLNPVAIISLEEFIEGALDDDWIREMLECDPSTVKVERPLRRDVVPGIHVWPQENSIYVWIYDMETSLQELSFYYSWKIKTWVMECNLRRPNLKQFVVISLTMLSQCIKVHSTLPCLSTAFLKVWFFLLNYFAITICFVCFSFHCKCTC